MTQEQSNEVVEPSAQAGNGATPHDQAEVNQTPEDQATVQSNDGENLIEVNGEKVPLEELKNGYLRQQDYTKKTTEVAQKRKELEEKERQLARQIPQATSQDGELPDEVKEAVNVLKQAGVVTKEDLAMLQAQQEDEKHFQSILEANPELKKHEKALRAIGQTDSRAWEDIIVDYGFMQKDKIAQAKARQAKGYSTPEDLEPKSKPVSEMSDEEYEEWKKENFKSGSSPFFRKKE